MRSDLGLSMAVETMEAMAEVGDVGDPSVVVYRLVGRAPFFMHASRVSIRCFYFSARRSQTRGQIRHG
jgi:hypothetical protein